MQGCREERSAPAKAKVFGSLIRKLRTERGLTQEMLAERTELSVSYIGFIERGENVATLIIVLSLAEALEVEAADLVRQVLRGR